MKSVGFICDNAVNAKDWNNLYNQELDVSAWDFQKIKEFSGSNTGNVVHRLAALKTMDENIKFIHSDTDPENIKSCKLLVMAVANLIDGNEQLWLNPLLDLSEKYSVPAVLFGVGAQTELNNVIPDMPPSLKQFFLKFTQNNYVLVRGETTRRALALNGIKNNIFVTGCQSLFLNNSKTLGVELEKKINSKIDNLIYFTQLKTGESLLNYLFERMDKAADHILVNGCDTTMWKLISGTLDPNTSDKYHSFTIPGEQKLFLKNLSGHTITPRIHGAMISIAAGLPTVCVAHDGRVKELCEMHKIPFCTLYDSIRKSAGEIFKDVCFSGLEFDKNRFELSKVYLNVFKTLNIKPSSNLLI